MTTAKPLARYGAMGARVASGFAPSRQLHRLLGHDPIAGFAIVAFPLAIASR